MTHSHAAQCSSVPHFCFCHILTSSGITEQEHRALQHGIYSLNSHQLPRSTEPCQPVPGVQFLGTAQKDVKRKTVWVEPSKGRFTPLSTSPSLFFSPPLWLCAAFQILNAWNKLELNRPLHRFINTYQRTLNLQHWRNAVSLRYINRAEITVFMFQLAWYGFCAGVKSIRYFVNITWSSLLATPTNASINHAIFYSMLSNFLDWVTPKMLTKHSFVAIVYG